jgi:type IX secretion system PorP/SprF family membrane protein
MGTREGRKLIKDPTPSPLPSKGRGRGRGHETLNRLKIPITIFLLFCFSLAFGQKDPLFTQYMYNKLEFNPGYAGSGGIFSMDLISRFQWTGMPGAPRTISFTAQTPLRNQHIGLGLFVYSDELGPSVDYGAMAAFAYRISFSATKLCFGLQAGFKYMDINWSKLNPKDSGDAELSGQVTNKAVPDADFGIYYYGSRFYTGLSVKHLFQNQIMISSAPPDGSASFTKLLRNYYGMAGGAIPLAENLIFMPSFLIKYVQNTPVQADFNAGFMFKNLLTLGTSYRTGNAIGFIIGLNLSNGLSFGYSYDVWFNTLQYYNSGSHEIRISYELDLFNKNRMLTPRFF